MSRRASLPGVDELFGARGPLGEQPSGEQPPGGRRREGDTATAEALARLRAAAATEPPEVVAARAAAAEQGLDVPSPEVAAMLSWAVTACEAKAVIEIGSAGGVTGLRLLAAMPEGGVLTSLEPDPETHGLTSQVLAGVPSRARVRSILQDVATLLDRLADGGYDLVLLQAAHADYPEHLGRARALLRPGGMLLTRGILPAGDHQEALTRFLHDLVEDPAFSTAVLPVDDGLAISTRLADPEPT